MKWLDANLEYVNASCWAVIYLVLLACIPNAWWHGNLTNGQALYGVAYFTLPLWASILGRKL